MSDVINQPTAEAIIATLRANEAALRERGVRHAALFGSRARGDAQPDSDIDILIETQPNTIEDLYTYVGLKDYVAGLFTLPVDVVNRDFLKPSIRPATEADIVYAF